MRRFNTVQALRALAAVMVAVFHSKLMFANDGTREQLWWWPGFSDFGDMGVSLFFVISGFIIATVLDRPNLSVIDYVWRRFMRVYPLLWIVVMVGIYHYFLRNWFAADFLAQTRHTWIKTFLIFPQDGAPFWNPAWTLEHEILFYFLAILIAPWATLAGLCCILLALGTLGYLFDFGWDYHLTANPQIYFAFGIASYLFRNAPIPLAAIVAMAGLFVSYADLYGVIVLPPWVTDTTFSAGAAGLIIILVQAERRGLVVPRPLITLGDASYSLYLWHWMTLPIVSMFYGIFGGQPETWRWIFVAVSITVAVISFYSIEKYFLSLAHRFSPATGASRP